MEVGKIRILIVEDHDILIKLLTLILNRVAIENIDVATNWKKAIEQFIVNDYDLVFMDIGLPGIHGLDLSYIFRRLDKRRNTEIIAITGYPITLQFIDECAQSGITNIIEKPYKPEDIEAALTKAKIPFIKRDINNVNTGFK